MNKLITLFVLLLILSLPVSLAYSLTYDANGNLISGDGYFRVYDASNHLRNVYSGSSLVNNNLLENYTWALDDTKIFIKYVYNNGSLNETVFYPQEDWVRVKNSSGTFDFFYAIQNGEIVAVKDFNGKNFYFHNDADGSPRLVTDQNGNVSEQTFYDPYGGVISGGQYTRFDYEGEEQDSATSTIDFDARMYNPKDPMFTQPDTIIQNVYDSQSLNHYSFEKNNPYKYQDETGHELVEAGLGLLQRANQEAKEQVLNIGQVYDQSRVLERGARGFINGLFGEVAPPAFGAKGVQEAYVGEGTSAAVNNENTEDFIYDPLEIQKLKVAQQYFDLRVYPIVVIDSNFWSVKIQPNTPSSQDIQNIQNKVQQKLQDMKTVAQAGVDNGRTAGDVVREWRRTGVTK